MDIERGTIQTVCGVISPKDLGVTLTHEHLDHKISQEAFKPRPLTPKYAFLSHAPFDFENLWWINYHPYSHLDNLKYDDLVTKDAVLSEMKFFKDNGGGSVVENSGGSSDLKFFQKISKESHVNIIAGTGFYVAPGQPAQVLNLTKEQIYNKIKDDFLLGCDGIKCGVVGEIGTSCPLDSFERRSLEASAEFQESYKVPVTIHPSRDKRSPSEVMRVFLEAGGIADKTVMSHLERTLHDDSDLLEFAKIGTYCQFDLFGVENSYYELSETLVMPSDNVRIERLRKLIDEGYLNKILISQDIHTKHRLMKFGGHGFSHILLNTIPQMMRRGHNFSEINQIIIANPAAWLTL